MIRSFIATIVLIPLAILIVLLAVANRAGVTISLDPFSTEAPALVVKLPLFLVILAALIAGVDRIGRAVSRLQDRERFSRQCARGETVRIRHLFADVGRYRRAAGGHGRTHADGAAHGRCLGARCELPCA